MVHGTKTHCMHLLANLNALAAVSKGMQAVKLCTNKILQFLTGDAS